MNTKEGSFVLSVYLINYYLNVKKTNNQIDSSTSSQV